MQLCSRLRIFGRDAVHLIRCLASSYNNASPTASFLCLPLSNPLSLKMRLLSPGLSALLAASASALGQNQTVSLNPSKGLLQLAGSGLNGQILVSSNDWWGVLRVAEDLACDVGKVTGRNLTLGNWLAAGSAKRDVPTGPPGGAEGEGRTAFPEGEHSGGWGWGGTSSGAESGTKPTLSPGHNVSVMESGGTTVYYTFQPVTGFVNVS